jgi:leucyl-tRNA synthetase
MKGYNVFFPHGFDAFGLPAENAAIKRKIHPKDWTMQNIQTMTSQLRKMGSIVDLENVTITCLPEYYRWNQWIFIKMFERGIAYLGRAKSNWCEVDQTVLADENIEGGRCWRCGSVVVKKEVDQWFLKITEYADRLVWPENPDVDWPESVRAGQNNWIGRSVGLIINFDGIEVFTTRPETIDGATFIVLAPEHPKVLEFTTEKQKKEISAYVEKAKAKSEQERKTEAKEKTGVATGGYVQNPVTGQKIPVFVADYVLSGYGTGAIMAVPDADERDREFAEKFRLPIVKTSLKAKPAGKKSVIYHLRDWSVSRQRYWGTPVPIIHCDKCGLVPVPEKDLPVELPYDVDFTPKGKPPLATNEKWISVKCPKCHGDAKRDPQTLDGFFDNSWYFYRYIDPQFTKGPFDSEKTAKIMPVDVYFGGAEHTLGHTLYSRFFTKFFKDIGLVNFDEYAKKRIQHGVILGPDGARMSKSRGNVINPDDVVAEYGADTVRLYLCFMMAYEDTAPWSTTAIGGVYRFLRRVWELQDKVSDTKLSSEDEIMMNQTIKKVESDLEKVKSNTAVAAQMSWLNHLSRKEKISKVEFRTLLLLLAPFAPHITEELWRERGEKDSIHSQIWPKYDEKYLKEETIKIPVQVNGKLRGVITVSPEETAENIVVKRALELDKVKSQLEGKKYKSIYVKGKILNFVKE